MDILTFVVEYILPYFEGKMKIAIVWKENA
jgi:hypothetical protein